MKYFLTKNWIVLTFAATMILIVVALLIYSSAPNETANEQVELESSQIEIENAFIDTQKVNDFIMDKIPNNDVFLKFHLENGEQEHITKEEYETAAFEMFYGAVSQEEITYLTTAITPESFQGIWGEEMDFEKREKEIIQYLNELNGNGTLTGMSYKKELDKYDSPTGNGTIILSYQNGSKREMPFTFVNMGEGHELITQINLNEIYEIEDAN